MMHELVFVDEFLRHVGAAVLEVAHSFLERPLRLLKRRDAIEQFLLLAVRG